MYVRGRREGKDSSKLTSKSFTKFSASFLILIDDKLNSESSDSGKERDSDT